VLNRSCTHSRPRAPLPPTTHALSFYPTHEQPRHRQCLPHLHGRYACQSQFMRQPQRAHSVVVTAVAASAPPPATTSVRIGIATATTAPTARGIGLTETLSNTPGAKVLTTCS
jgi:hypothetical protein